MGDQDDLGEAIRQTPQKVYDSRPTVLIQRSEDLIEDQEGEGLPRALSYHLTDGEAKCEIGNIFLAS